MNIHITPKIPEGYTLARLIQIQATWCQKCSAWFCFDVYTVWLGAELGHKTFCPVCHHRHEPNELPVLRAASSEIKAQ